MTKNCPRCKEDLPIERFHVNKKTNHPSSYCKECKESHRRARRKHHRENKTETYVAMRAREGRAKKLNYANLRLEILKEYGGKCNCCGETIVEFLSIDHVAGDGAAHRKKIGIGEICSWLKNNGFPKDNFQILCYNCNRGKGVKKECPHATMRRASAGRAA